MSRGEKDIFSVSRLNREVKAVLEGHFPLIWVEGELSNVARPASGHLYFSLKDDRAQVRCAMFRSRAGLTGFRAEAGQQVLVRARVGLYEGRGDFQLIVESMQPAGDGRLQLAFEQLKQKLAAEGLFDEDSKQAVPAMPACIGVITSPTGAAIRDVLSILARRFPAIPVIVYPVPVQGEGAAQKIAGMIDLADRRRDCDVLILTRGGGSIEDLWSFNEECVARAIHRCELPLISAIGHEIDFTIADFVADHRAPTPSAAAELVSPDGKALFQHWQQLAGRLAKLMVNDIRQREQNLAWLSRRLVHPGRRLQELAQRTDDLQLRLIRAQQQKLRNAGHQLAQQQGRLLACNPQHQLEQTRQGMNQLDSRLRTAMRHQLSHKREQLQATMRMLDTVSPLATLERGYAIVTRSDDGTVVRDADSLKPGDRVKNRFARGHATCVIEEIEA